MATLRKVRQFRIEWFSGQRSNIPRDGATQQIFVLVEKCMELHGMDDFFMVFKCFYSIFFISRFYPEIVSWQIHFLFTIAWNSVDISWTISGLWHRKQVWRPSLRLRTNDGTFVEAFQHWNRIKNSIKSDWVEILLWTGRTAKCLVTILQLNVESVVRISELGVRISVASKKITLRFLSWGRRGHQWRYGDHSMISKTNSAP